MCGRFVLVTPPDHLARRFGAVVAAGVDPDRALGYNVAPTRQVYGVADRAGGGRTLDTYRWGLVPSWATDPSVGARLFNARSETVATKPSFRSAFARRRLVVPVDGFYEWAGEEGRRTPYYFRSPDGDPLALAGLWETWRPKEESGSATRELRTCTIVTAPAGPDVAPVHDRMPVILDGGAVDAWLDGDGADMLQHLLAPAGAGRLAGHPVGRAVGNVRNDGPELIEPAPGGGGAEAG
ncbi:MAG: SOS response-associated peptidase [Actinomycetota bacterium]|jgi:putative SOS response-associated peptidase YedK|nr:SOS response-associated peptidase [Actinomycetota bacterium]